MGVLIQGRGLIDGCGSGLREGAALLVEQGRIREVGTQDDLRPKAAEIWDFGDAVLLPGFIDAHTHVTIRPGEGDQHAQVAMPPVQQALRGVDNVRRMLASGVTTARVMGERAGIDFAFKQAIAAGELPGPRLFVSGTALSASNGHGAALGVADGVDEVRKTVRKNLKMGADHIKLFVTGGVSSRGDDIGSAQYSFEEVAVAVEEAHRAGRKVAAHAHGGEGVSFCAAAGVDSVEHGGLLSEENIAEMRRAGTRLVLTNAIAFHPEGIERGDADDPGIMAKMHEVRSAIARSFGRIHGSGLRFALGSDAMHGWFAYELEWLVEHGLPAEEAIVAATKRGAEVLGEEAELGTLEAGKLADLVVLRSNPLEDIRAVYQVAAVIKEGRIVVDERAGA